MSIVQGIGQKGVSETIAQIGWTWVCAMNDFAVAARGLQLADNGDGLKRRLRCGKKMKQLRVADQIGGVKQCCTRLPRWLDGRSRRLRVEAAWHPWFLAFQ